MQVIMKAPSPTMANTSRWAATAWRRPRRDGIAHAVEVGRQDQRARGVHRVELGGEEGVVAVVHRGDGVVRHLPPHFVEEARRIDPPPAVVGVPFLAVGLLVAADLLLRAAAGRAAPRRARASSKVSLLSTAAASPSSAITLAG
jgi:hypothetical protein